MSAICNGNPKIAIRIMRCDKCKRRRKMEQRTYEWYAPSRKCLKCGTVYVPKWEQ